MASQTPRQTAAEQGQRMPVGTIHVVDPSPLKWLLRLLGGDQADRLARLSRSRARRHAAASER